MQINETAPYLTANIKINSKYIKDLNIRLATVKLLEDNIGGKLRDIGVGSAFLDITPKHELQNKNGQHGLHQAKKLLYSKGKKSKGW